MNVIETKNLKKIYSQGEIKVNALNDVSINFKQGVSDEDMDELKKIMELSDFSKDKG